MQCTSNLENINTNMMKSVDFFLLLFLTEETRCTRIHAGLQSWETCLVWNNATKKYKKYFEISSRNVAPCLPPPLIYSSFNLTLHPVDLLFCGEFAAMCRHLPVVCISVVIQKFALARFATFFRRRFSGLARKQDMAPVYGGVEGWESIENSLV